MDHALLVDRSITTSQRHSRSRSARTWVVTLKRVRRARSTAGAVPDRRHCRKASTAPVTMVWMASYEVHAGPDEFRPQLIGGEEVPGGSRSCLALRGLGPERSRKARAHRTLCQYVTTSSPGTREKYWTFRVTIGATSTSAAVAMSGSMAPMRCPARSMVTASRDAPEICAESAPGYRSPSASRRPAAAARRHRGDRAPSCGTRDVP